MVDDSPPLQTANRSFLGPFLLMFLTLCLLSTSPLWGAVRGIYFGGPLTDSVKVAKVADHLVAAGGNVIVFDVKNRRGDLGYFSSLSIARVIGANGGVSPKNLRKYIDLLQRRGIHVVARLTCFEDWKLAQGRLDLVPLSRTQGDLWRQQGELHWVDPSLPAVQDYLLAIIGEVVHMGVDEIQLDYLRFPTEGDVGDAVFAFNPAFMDRDEVITNFVRRVRKVLEGTGVLLSADIFGVIPWGRIADQQSTGQNMAALLPLLDAISPMLYPSHFYGPFGQMERPVDYPYHLVYEGCRKIAVMAALHGVVVRPWLQAFSYGVEDFDAGYVVEQMYGAEDSGAQGWLLWNMRGRYQVGLEAMQDWARGKVDSAAVRRRFPAWQEEVGRGELGIVLPTD